jgi:hypothetical protein
MPRWHSRAHGQTFALDARLERHRIEPPLQVPDPDDLVAAIPRLLVLLDLHHGYARRIDEFLDHRSNPV